MGAASLPSPTETIFFAAFLAGHSALHGLLGDDNVRVGDLLGGGAALLDDDGLDCTLGGLGTKLLLGLLDLLGLLHAEDAAEPDLARRGGIARKREAVVAAAVLALRADAGDGLGAAADFGGVAALEAAASEALGRDLVDDELAALLLLAVEAVDEAGEGQEGALEHLRGEGLAAGLLLEAAARALKGAPDGAVLAGARAAAVPAAGRRAQAEVLNRRDHHLPHRREVRSGVRVDG